MRSGIPYSLREAKLVMQHPQTRYLDEYHRHLFMFLIREVERLSRKRKDKAA